MTSISGFFSWSSMKFCMKFGLWTLITGKNVLVLLPWQRLLWQSKNIFRVMYLANYGVEFRRMGSKWVREHTMWYLLPGKWPCCHSNQKIQSEMKITCRIGIQILRGHVTALIPHSLEPLSRGALEGLVVLYSPRVLLNQEFNKLNFHFYRYGSIFARFRRIKLLF